MGTLPDLDEFRLAAAFKPLIGFRVVASGGDERYRNTIGPRDPQADATSLTLQHHLAWDRAPSPFVSLWKSWPRAVRWAEDRASFGARDIVIAAVWIHDRVVYDAHKAASKLPLPPHKRLNYYKDEVITLGLGGEDDYSTLARFFWVTERLWEPVSFFGMSSSTLLPIGPLVFETTSFEAESERREGQRWQKDGFAALRDEVYSNTGCYDEPKTSALARLLCKGPQSLRPTRQDIASDELIAQLAELGI